MRLAHFINWYITCEMLRLHAINLTHTVSKHLSTWMLQIHEHGTVSWEDKHLGIDILTSTFFQVKKNVCGNPPSKRFEKYLSWTCRVCLSSAQLIVCKTKDLHDSRNSRVARMLGHFYQYCSSVHTSIEKWMTSLKE